MASTTGVPTITGPEREQIARAKESALRTEAQVDTKNPDRGPLLIIAGQEDHTVPPAVSRAAFEQQQKHNIGVTEYIELPGRGHALTVDHGWRDVASLALAFIRRHV